MKRKVRNNSSFWKLLFVLCVAGSFSVLASFSYGKITHTHHVHGSPLAAKVAKPALKRFEYPFACSDTDNRCLTLQAETPRSKGEPKLKRVMVVAENGKQVVRWVHQ